MAKRGSGLSIRPVGFQYEAMAPPRSLALCLALPCPCLWLIDVSLFVCASCGQVGMEFISAKTALGQLETGLTVGMHQVTTLFFKEKTMTMFPQQSPYSHNLQVRTRTYTRMVY